MSQKGKRRRRTSAKKPAIVLETLHSEGKITEIRRREGAPVGSDPAMSNGLAAPLPRV